MKIAQLKHWIKIDIFKYKNLYTHICSILIQINHNAIVVLALRMPSEVNLTNTKLGNPPTSPSNEFSLKILKIFSQTFVMK